MNPFIKALYKLVDEGRPFIGEKSWVKIINKADKETLVQLKSEEGIWYSKYFTRDDWLGEGVRQRLLDRIESRLSEDGAYTAFLEYLKDFSEVLN